MAYSRRQVTDHVTKMNKDLYDNVQDGIDECKEDLGAVNTVLGSINEYNPKITYSKGSYVIHGGTMYESVVDITLPEEWTVEHWKPATVLSLLQSVSADVPFKFGVDENGNYGFIKDGADTVTPFKQGGIHISSYRIYADSTPGYVTFEVRDLSLLKISSIYSRGDSPNRFVILGGNSPLNNVIDNKSIEIETALSNGTFGTEIFASDFSDVTWNSRWGEVLNDIQVDISAFDYVCLWFDMSVSSYNYIQAYLKDIEIS